MLETHRIPWTPSDEKPFHHCDVENFAEFEKNLVELDQNFATSLNKILI